MQGRTHNHAMRPIAQTTRSRVSRDQPLRLPPLQAGLTRMLPKQAAPAEKVFESLTHSRFHIN